MERFKIWFKNFCAVIKKWILEHFTMVELVSVMDTFGAEIAGVLIFSYHAVVSGQFTWQTALGMIGSAIWRSAYKAVRKLITIYIAKLKGGDSAVEVIPPPIASV